MFKLQRLEITGFKSFADYTEIVFTGEGITAVVGPNGCGKSNVADAIAWVLGEQKARSLRGEEMKDVVFQGTSRRSASGMAEVVLHLVAEEMPFEDDELSGIDATLSEIDERAVVIEETETSTDDNQDSGNGFHAETEIQTNETAEIAVVEVVAAAQTKIKTKRHWRPRKLDLDFDKGEAISVTRRLYLSGESEYLLNGKACRLRDIQDLFAGTGLSGAHYALIEQGRIGQILSAKPSDRRALVEEAAGISKFRTRQRAAEARLESAKTNLGRISDIVEEIEKQANALRRQAAKTRRFKILQEELRAGLRQTFAAEGKFLTELVEDLEAKLKEAARIERGIFWEVAEKDEAFREATREARDAEENLSALRSRHAENALERDRASREIRYREEQIINLQSRLATLEEEIKNTEQRLKLVRAEAERVEKDERAERAEAEKTEAELERAEQKYQSKLDRLRQIETEIEKHRTELLTHTAAVERFAEIERQLENAGERLSERAEGLRREGERARQTFAEHVGEKQKLEKSLAQARKSSAELQEKQQKILETVIELRNALQADEKTLSKLHEDFSRAKHRLETLRELEANRAVYVPAVQKLFAEQKKVGVRFLGTLADALDVEEHAEKAVENVFGAFLQTVLVETKSDARKVAKYLGENNVGRVAVLTVQSSELKVKNSKKQNAGSKSQAANLIDFLGVSGDFAEILRNVFPRETSARLVEKLDNVKARGDEILVTFDGDLSFGGKLFVSGKANVNEKNSSLLAFKRELRELDAESERLAGEIKKSEKQTAAARENLNKKEQQAARLQSLLAQADRELIGRRVQAQSVALEIERAERHKKVVAEETEQIERELAEVRGKQTEARSNAEKAEKARLRVAEKLAETSKMLEVARQNAERENAALSEKRTLAATSAERQRSAQSALRRVETEAKELESRLARQRLEINETENNVGELRASIEKIKRKIETAEDEQIQEQGELAGAVANLKLAREKADAMSSELARLNQQSAEARNERAAVEVQRTEAITRLQNLNENCSQELNQTLVELVEEIEIEKNFDLEATRKRVEDLRRQLENFGAVNMLALEELSETEERLSFLSSQRQDIIDGISAAEEALREIKERSRERFRTAFEAINRYFSEFFLELFGGGRGEMVLLESEDVLEAGIEVVAQPPGKRLQNILLLSGGEKAMTAIALVMAVFQYRPSPFCLLDEVDAPLDDANVGRFVQKITSMSEKTQFIIITHNKRTMEAARALYGVTMAEAGVSKVVSVKFE